MADIEAHIDLARSARAVERSAASRQSTADRSTQLAVDRTMLAAERTYAAWVRTGLTALAAGIGARALLGKVVPDWLALTAGGTLVLFSAFCFGAGVWREMTPRFAPLEPDVKRLPAALLIAVNGVLALVSLAAFVGVLASAAPAATTCPIEGATYVARPLAPSNLGYRLRIEALPRSDASAAVATLWRFQTLANGRQINEIRMHYSCPGGSSPCSVSPPSRPGEKGGLYSDVVRLNRDFTQTRGDATPYALVLPGFAQGEWLFTAEEMRSPDLTLARGAVDGPDLSEQIVWTLSACGRAR